MILKCSRHALCVLAWWAGAATAQDLPRLAPSTYSAKAGDVVTLKLADARPGAADVAWDDDRVLWSMHRIAGTQENSDRAPRADENAAAGTLRLATSGAAVVGVDFKPRTVTLDGAAFAKLVAGRTDIKAPPEGAPVRVHQSVKTIIRVGESEPGQSPNVTSKTGQQVELRPVFDPTGVGIGSDVPVVVYAGDGKVPGAKLVATHVPTGEREEFTANASAIGHFKLSRPGEWRLEMRHLAEVKNPKSGEPAWVLSTATLTFEARDQGEGAK